jgi:hypothetical protein
MGIISSDDTKFSYRSDPEKGNSRSPKLILNTPSLMFLFEEERKKDQSHSTILKSSKNN